MAQARCGRTDEHGGHRNREYSGLGDWPFCAGNVNIVAAVVADDPAPTVSPMVARLQRGDTRHHTVIVAAPDTMRD